MMTPTECFEVADQIRCEAPHLKVIERRLGHDHWTIQCYDHARGRTFRVASKVSWQKRRAEEITLAAGTVLPEDDPLRLVPDPRTKDTTLSAASSESETIQALQGLVAEEG